LFARGFHYQYDCEHPRPGRKNTGHIANMPPP
jgi:hypothetical protein